MLCEDKTRKIFFHSPIYLTHATFHFSKDVNRRKYVNKVVSICEVKAVETFLVWIKLKLMHFGGFWNLNYNFAAFVVRQVLVSLLLCMSMRACLHLSRNSTKPQHTKHYACFIIHDMMLLAGVCKWWKCTINYDEMCSNQFEEVNEI